MTKKFITKKTRKKSKFKILFILTMFIIGIYASYKNLEKSKIELKDKEFVTLIVNSTFHQDTIIEKLTSKSLELTNPLKLMNNKYTKYLDTEKEVLVKEDNPPLIYLYNTHQLESYAPSNYAEFSINPTVIMNDYILEDIFNKKGYKVYVEESSIKDILDQNNWRYSNSYKASRILLEQRYNEYPSLKYFIDIHRDSLSKEKTTININNKDYAKVLFIVGLENPNYENNLAFTEKINNKINELYPNLSKGIYKKSGPGVNGIYNQDFSKNTILIEIGGEENTTTEVLNTALAFASCFLEVLNEENT